MSRALRSPFESVIRTVMMRKELFTAPGSNAKVSRVGPFDWVSGLISSSTSDCCGVVVLVKMLQQ